MNLVIVWILRCRKVQKDIKLVQDIAANCSSCYHFTATCDIAAPCRSDIQLHDWHCTDARDWQLQCTGNTDASAITLSCLRSAVTVTNGKTGVSKLPTLLNQLTWLCTPCILYWRSPSLSSLLVVEPWPQIPYGRSDILNWINCHISETVRAVPPEFYTMIQSACLNPSIRCVAGMLTRPQSTRSTPRPQTYAQGQAKAKATEVKAKAKAKTGAVTVKTNKSI